MFMDMQGQAEECLGEGVNIEPVLLLRGSCLTESLILWMHIVFSEQKVENPS